MSYFPGAGPGGPLVSMETALASLLDWHFRKGTWGGGSGDSGFHI